MLGTTTLATILFAVADTAGVSGHTVIQISLLCLIVPLAICGQHIESNEFKNAIRKMRDELREDWTAHRIDERRQMYSLARANRRRSVRKDRN